MSKKKTTPPWFTVALHFSDAASNLKGSMGIYRQLGGCFTGLSTVLVNYTQLICRTLIIQTAFRNDGTRRFSAGLLEAAG